MDAQPGLGLCCSHATKSGFLAMLPTCYEYMYIEDLTDLTGVVMCSDLNLSPNLPLIYSSEQLIKSLAF